MLLNLFVYFYIVLFSCTHAIEQDKWIVGIIPNSITLVLGSINNLLEGSSLNLKKITPLNIHNIELKDINIINFLEGEMLMLILDQGKLKNEKHLQDIDGVKFVEKDQKLQSQALLMQREPPSFGLARICQRTQYRLNAPYIYYDSQGKGIDVYVLDSGINETHEDFEGRARLSASFVKNESEEDLFGHGTHVSGIVAGRRYGVAKKAQVFGVKILNRKGEGSVSNALYAIAHVIRESQRRQRRTIINLSLAGEFSEALNRAVDIAYSKANIPVIVAAGNQARDACTLSPGSAKGVMAVGNSDQTDTISRTSNYGACVTLFAPGAKIRSASNLSNSSSRLLSGTSMAAPHVAGIAALFWATQPSLNANHIYTLIQNAATRNVLRGVPFNTPNLLAYNQF